MNRIDRLFGIIVQLQSKKYLTADQIADRYDISVRTVYRDIKALDEFGVPISHEVKKGYFIVPGYFLSPKAFTNEEIYALSLLNLLAQQHGDASIAKHSDAALDKLKATLTGAQLEKVLRLIPRIDVAKTRTKTGDFLTAIQNSMAQECLLKLEYSLGNQMISYHELEISRLIYRKNKWRVVAWCWEKEEELELMLAQFSRVKETMIPFRKIKS